MIKANIKIVIRHLLKNKVFSIINILGLSIGLSMFLLIYLYVSYEKSYEKFYPDSERIFRVTTDNFKQGTITARHAITFAKMGEFLHRDFPEIETQTTTLKYSAAFNLRFDETLFTERNMIAVDSNFLKVFPFKIIAGDKINPLGNPNSIVLTESLAKRYFKNESPIGKTASVYSGINRQFTVTAVIEDSPHNTHYKFDMLVSLSTFQQMMDRNGWGIYQYFTYIKVKEGVDVPELQSKVKYVLKEYKDENTTMIVNLQPIEDIHLYSDFDYEPEIHGNARTVNFLIIIALAILIIAWVNYVNLSTAKAVDRAKEVALKKIVGASKRRLIIQFLMESLVINIVSMMLAATIVQLALTFMRDLIEVQLDFWLYNVWQLAIGLLVISTILAGYYPAAVLSSYKPISILRTNLWTSGRGILLRKALVIFQFATSLALISGTFIVYKQIGHMQSQELGVDLNHVLTIVEPDIAAPTWQERVQKIETYHDQLSGIPGVLSVGSASNVPDGGKADIFAFSAGVKVEGDMEGDRSTYVLSSTNADFMEAIGVKILAGRNFNKLGIRDSSMAIINESARKKLGFLSNQEALNKRFKLGTWPRTYSIIGVSRDFNRQSLKHGVEPTIYRPVWRGGGGYTVIKLQENRTKEVMGMLTSKWASDFPNAPFEYYFLDQQFDKAYKNDQQFGTFFGIFAVLAIFIACLGLFGLSSFIALQKTKEIGIRKVLGASINGIVILMYKNFLILVSISILVGLPIIYLIMENWLSNYTYRIEIPLWVFILSALSLFLISFITVAFQSLKAANVNPVESLKYE